MGRTAQVLNVGRSTEEGIEIVHVQCDPGGGAIVTAELFTGPGDDSLPLPGDSVALQEGTGAGVEQAVGFVDSANHGTAEPGERRSYARDEDGVPVCEISLQKNGRILIKVLKTGGAPIDIESDGVINVKSPDVRLGSAPGGRKVACLGDLVVGSIRALSAAPGSPIVPVPPAVPTATGGVGFAGQIVSAVESVKAGA